MSDRTPVKLTLVFVLIMVAVYANLDLARDGFRYSRKVLGLLGWQGPVDVRSLQLREGLDLQGGLQVLLQVDPSQGSFTPSDLEVAKNVIQNRVDSLGVTEAKVQIQGQDKIVVELPGVDDPELAERTIGSTAKLEFIYGGDPSAGDQVPLAGDSVETTAPTLWRELPEDFKSPRLADPKQLDEIRSISATGAVTTTGATTSTTSAATPATTPGTAAATETTTTPSGATGAATTTTGASATGATAATTTTTGASATGALTPTDTTEGEATGALTTTETTTTTGALTTTAGTTTTATSPLTTTEATTATATGAVTSTAETTKTFASKVYPTILTGASIQSATVTRDQMNQPAVSFTLNGDGGARLLEFTRGHIQQAMPIVLDGKIISSPIIQANIGSQGQITGKFTDAEAESLAVQLRSGSLPVKLQTVGRTSIGPTLGAESVHLAVLGGIIGMIGVIFFMIAYYRLPGILASMALLTYVLFSLTIFRLIPVTLTLAGIAGFALSIGMAVDANVLIFERMKEELRAGRRMRAATDIGFERAWPSIRDSNLSTLITCAILFWFGSQFGASIVKGFAVTLSVGVLTSMFTAIFVTRTFLEVTGRYLIGDLSSVIPAETPRLRALFGF